MSADEKQNAGAQKLDLRGLMCPEPVLRTKKLLDAQPEGAVEVLVDSDINVMNLTRLTKSMGLQLESRTNDGGYAVVIQKSGGKAAGNQENTEISENAESHSHETPARKGKVAESSNAAAKPSAPPVSVVFISKDTFGEGDREFSASLMNVFLQTILQSGHRPQAILLANTGVKLMDPENSVSKVLEEFQAAGVEVFACGLCVEFYGLKDKIAKEQITNMFAICEYLFSADKIISP
ncbi:MAG: sulfurtransferase-like selenium metabolism protein YedF [Leptolyngbya sp.]|nr:sulfurtransferase-like selenium metabolism protein YedF [Candidatus Melainabacteria bacterium]